MSEVNEGQTHRNYFSTPGILVLKANLGIVVATCIYVHDLNKFVGIFKIYLNLYGYFPILFFLLDCLKGKCFWGIFRYVCLSVYSYLTKFLSIFIFQSLIYSYLHINLQIYIFLLIIKYFCSKNVWVL